MRLDRARAEELLGRIRGRQVAVLGDLMLDEYLFGDVDRISPEAPVPIVRVSRERAVLGGAANVAANLKSVGAEPVLVGTLRQDHAGIRLQALLRNLEIRADRLVVDPTRPTIIKTRVIGQQQQMLRIDREEPGECEDAAAAGLCASLDRALDQASALIISDYAKGTVGELVMGRVRELCAARGVPWIVDPKPSHRALYQGAPLMTPNTKELAELTGLPAKADADLAVAGQALMDTLGLQGLLVTRSEKGMALFAAGAVHRAPWMIPTEAQEVFDVSGAGDTVIAVFSAALATGADWQDAAMLANAAAGVVVGKIGTATASPAEILRHYQDQEAL
jgi:D-beta-D-heptose 7-phosphate kinase/D-beta-D-heptose 1-phosphate adenosyltransferase